MPYPEFAVMGFALLNEPSLPVRRGCSTLSSRMQLWRPMNLSLSAGQSS